MANDDAARAMRWDRKDGRGLAEIVGTLMLVVIVVAAATAFSFFVAAYQKQLQSEETLNHDRSLEALKVIGISEEACSPSSCLSPCAVCFADLNLTIASLDVNSIEVTGFFINQLPIVNYTAVIGGASETPCYNSSLASSSPPYGVVPCQPISIPAFSSFKVRLNLDDEVTLCINGLPSCSGYFALGGPTSAITPHTYLLVQTLTGLDNEFAASFVPPVALASLTFLDGYPVLDGSASYQPIGNVSIVSWTWAVVPVPVGNLSTCTNNSKVASCSGEKVQFGDPNAFKPMTPYVLYLNVTNDYGLQGATVLDFRAP